MRINYTFILLWTSVFSFGQTDALSVITVDEAVNLALENNPAVANHSLKIEQNRVMKSALLNIQPTELKYKSGQIYTPEHDRYIELNQSFGSLLEHISNYRLANEYLQISRTESDLAKKNITAEVKSAYYFWVYTYNKLLLLEQKENVFSDIERIAELQYKNGDIDQLEKTSLCAEAAGVRTTLNMLYDEIEIARNKLKQLIVTEAEIIPSIRELPIYKIDKAADTSWYSNNLLASYYKGLSEINNLKVKSKRASFFPEISLGIINQHITPYSGLWAWQFGLSFPVLFFVNKAEVQQAKIQAQMSANEYKYQLFVINKTIENLILELNKTFKNLMHYDQFALAQAEQIVLTATLQLEKEEIEYIEYARRIAESISIKLKYLEILNQYNQTAIQLEFYAD